MTILWFGGEDIDFPAGNAVANNGSGFRSSYARTALNCSSGVNTVSARSLAFSGGALTSFWLHAQLTLATGAQPYRAAGLAQTANGTASGLYVGNDSSTASKVALWKLDGSTWTELASESGASLSSAPQAVDMQVTNFGATATVNVYVAGTLKITYSGSTAITGVSNLDCVSLPGNSGVFVASEIIVADADTRAMSLVTMAPNAAGDANNWTTGTYASINPTTINDANVIAVNTTGQDFQANCIDLPSGSFSVNAVKVAARAEVTAGSTPTSVKLGVKTGGTVNVDAGHTLTAAFTTYERLMTTNPVTSAAWLSSDMNALQMDLQSA
jgi:hypothetical protein